MNTKTLILAAGLLACNQGAWAGRPLGSEDAGVADFGNCQIESWTEKAGREHAFVAGAACGVLPGLELGVDYTRPHPRDDVRGEAGMALKWVPESWKFKTSAGDLNFGLKLAQSFAHPVDHHWRGAETSGLILASLAPSDQWTIHANLGAVRDRESHDSAGLLNLAAVWAPQEHFLLFAEVQANTRSETFGGTVKSVGGRWWLIPKVLGLDLTASRQSGSGSTLWTVGFGWYGISF
jgi:hypothetical protein